MRALFVSHTIPYPLNTGGNQRIYNLLRAVADVSEVTFLCPESAVTTSESTEILRSICAEVRFFPSGSASESIARYPSLRRIGSLFKYHVHPVEPALFRWYAAPRAAELIAGLAPYYDLIWAERLISMSWLPPSLPARVLVDLDDILHRKMAYRLRHAPFYSAMPLECGEFLKLRRVEKNILDLPFEFLVCSSSDKHYLRGDARVHVVPNGMNTAEIRKSPGQPASQPMLLFCGVMNTAANVDAICFFVTRILPSIQKKLPQVRLTIVGRDPDSRVRKLHSGSDVIVTGEVDSVEPYMREAGIVVAPIRFGSGTRIKILEAMAYGRPIVSTTIGAEGLDVTNGEHLLLADAPSHFAEACVRLMRDPELSHKIAVAGRELVQSVYSWDQIRDKLKSIILGARFAETTLV